MKRRNKNIVQMFEQGEDLPLWSGTPQRVIVAAFRPTLAPSQPSLPGLEIKMNSEPKRAKHNLLSSAEGGAP